MSESIRTLIYVGVAAGLGLIAGGMHWYSGSRGDDEFTGVGQEFYPAFTDPLTATSLRVVSYSEEEDTSKTFEVKEKSPGRWVITSHMDYEVDGGDRLAQTAASVVGLVRGAVISRSAADHEQYGVVDPLDDQTASPAGRGDRITLMGKDDDVLADYIIGKQVEDRPGVYYIRVPKEPETFLAELKVNLSTRFADWIKTNLLDLGGDKLVRINIERYTIDEQQGVLQGEETSELTREKTGDKWKLTGFDEPGKEVNQSHVDELVRLLEDLRIDGVRKKPEGLTPDLVPDMEYARKNRIDPQSLMSLLLRNLRAYGFPTARTPEGQLTLVANEGSLYASCRDGVIYHLLFGEVFTGSDLEVELGFQKEKAPEKKDEEMQPEGEKQPDDGEKLEKHRYLMVRAFFDASLVKKPILTEPVKPEPSPEGQEPTPEQKKALTDYEAAKSAYDKEQKEYQEDLKAGEKRAGELAAKFAPWYYVISAQNFEDLRLARADLIQDIPPAPPTTPMPGLPNFPGLPAPGTNPATQPQPVREPLEAPRP